MSTQASSSSSSTSSSSSSSSSLFSLSEDPNSPYFLYHSDNANSVIVSPLLNGPNYLSWSRSFSLAISIKNKLGFLDGTIQTPSLNSSLYTPWLRCNNLILSWLLNSISKDIASNLLYINSAKQVWDKLKTRFSQPDDARIYHLQHQFSSIIQGSQSVSEYFTQLNAIWEELHIYRPLPFCSCGNCTCAALKLVGDVQQQDYVFKFLMGLNDSFAGVRGQIILMSPLPSLDKAFSLILQEERQREARNLVLPISESSALATYQSNVLAAYKERSEVTCGHCGKT